MELWIIWRERRDDIEAWQRGVIRPPDRPSTAKYLVEIASVVLITGGIVGELWIGVKITSINGGLRSKNAALRSKTDELLGLAIQKTAEANERAALANERAEREATARAAMLSQLQPRTFTKEQMGTFVAAIKGKVIELNVFTLPDPEAAQYGFQVIDGLQKAGVRVAWYPTTAPYFLVPGVGSSGLTLYESQNGHVGKVLGEAFLKIGQMAPVWLAPESPGDLDKRLPTGAVPLSSIPSPALFISLKQPAFTAYPEYLLPPGVKIKKPPWE